ncbi:MAG: zinc-ribbon domain-containing protein [Promethearchaeota archaeon]
MYCKNCGAELELENQRYCQNCGSEIQYSTSSSQTSSIRDPYKPMSVSPPQYEILETKKPKKDKPGSYTKACLGFGVVGLVIAIISFNIGSTIIMDPYFYYYSFRRLFIGLIVAHIIGLIFGIISRINYGKAEEREPESSILRAGNITSILGLIFNSILLLIATVLAL